MKRLATLFAQIRLIAGIEAQQYRRHPRFLAATLVVALIPALYVLIYLSSVWDPTANTRELSVALVNLDQSVDYRGHVFNVGEELIGKLKAKPMFGYRDMRVADDARQQVREGKIAFALIVPPDFSSNAIPGAKAGAGKLEVFISEGNSYQSATLARHFAETLAQKVNESLNEQRWALVLSSALGSQDRIERLRDAVRQVQSGAQELAVATHQAHAGADALRGGSAQMRQGVEQLTGGVKELAQGLRTLNDKQPAPAELSQLRQGAEALVAGHGDLGKGLVELRSGNQKLRDGVTGFHEEAKGSILVSDRLTDGLGQLSEGLGSLDSGLQSAIVAQQKLGEGAERLSVGVGSLTAGVSAMGAGVRTMVNKMPRDAQLDKLLGGSTTLEAGSAELAIGLDKIDAGARHLSGGIDLLVGSLPADAQAVSGSAKGLANSVEPSVEVAAPVQNNGSSFASNIIPAALWLGAGIAAFLIHVRLQPRQARDFSRPAQMLGKIAVPSAIVLLQALFVMLAVFLLLRIQVAHPFAFVLTLVVSSLTFVTIVFALTRALGDAGKALALLFLAVQLSSSGGVLPVELSGHVFMGISPWLPLTWVVRAIKACLFDAYDGAWLLPLSLVAVAGLLAALMATLVGRWRFVDADNVRPALDI